MTTIIRKLPTANRLNWLFAIMTMLIVLMNSGIAYVVIESGKVGSTAEALALVAPAAGITMAVNILIRVFYRKISL